ncbi:MAG: magnesium transporter CorA family protein [Candidatus Sigynarchaeota archaeon]
MIRYFVLENKKLLPATEFIYDKITWCDIVKPSEAELIDIVQKFKLNLEDLEDCLDETIRPRFTTDLILGYQLLVLRIARSMDVDMEKSSTDPIGIVMTKDNKIITIHMSVPSYFNEVVEAVQRLQPDSYLMVVLDMIHFLVDQLAMTAQKITLKVRDLEKKVLQSHKPRDIHEPFMLNAYLIYFVTSMLGNLNTLRAFNHKHASLKETDVIAFEKLDDIITDMEQVFTYSSIYRDSLNNILDAYASVINNNLTTVMKIVGSLTLILTIPSIIASFYGMNVNLWIPTNPDNMISWIAFPSIILGTMIFCLILYSRFKKANWL